MDFLVTKNKSVRGVYHWWRTERAACGVALRPLDSAWLTGDEALDQVDCPKCRHLMRAELALRLPHKQGGIA